MNIKYNYATNFLKHDELVTFPAMDIFAAQESERVNKEIKENYELVAIKIRQLYDQLKNYESTIEELQQKLLATVQALEDIKNWNDDLEDEWEDQGFRAIAVLKQLK